MASSPASLAASSEASARGPCDDERAHAEKETKATNTSHEEMRMALMVAHRTVRSRILVAADEAGVVKGGALLAKHRRLVE